MKKILLIGFFFCGMLSFAQKYVDIQDLEILGRAFENTEGLYGRLPLDMKSEYRPDLWSYGAHSAGVAVRFSGYNVTELLVKWSVKSNFSMKHMASSGIQGVDFYIFENGKWQYLGTGHDEIRIPLASGPATIIRYMDEGKDKEFLAYLPLYNNTVKVEIGGCMKTWMDGHSICHDCTIAKPKSSILRKGANKPIVFYGTSIVQGGCASRPGMVHTSIIERALQTEVINLGFSGNAQCDKSMLKTLKRIDASAYVLDFMPNMTSLKMIQDSAEYFIDELAKDKPNAKIYIIENYNFPTSIVTAKNNRFKMENDELRAIYNKLKDTHKNLVYIDTEGIIGDDGEGTVDGVHLTDLGFMRLAENLLKQMSASTTLPPSVAKPTPTLKAYTSGKTIIVENAQGKEVQLFNAAGQFLVSEANSGGEVRMPVAQSGVYIVKVESETVKVLVE